MDDTQVNNLILDFINLFLVSMYILNFRNPVLVKSVHKIFWQFPTMSDSMEQLNRLEPDVLKQLKWRSQPVSIDEPKYKSLKSQMEKIDK